MKSHIIKTVAAFSLTFLLIPSAMAGGIKLKHAYSGYPYTHKHSYGYPSGYVVRIGSVTFVSGNPSYYPGYPDYHGYAPAYGYKHGHKSHAYPKYHQKNYKKHLPSTHIHGAYPFKKNYGRYRVNPHASSYQKKHAYGHGYKSYGYNHFSRRGNGSYYRY